MLVMSIPAGASLVSSGWERCPRPVFAGTGDADSQRRLGALTRLREQLRRQPREDLLSLERRAKP
jgi:hypothetical protein